jgi:hypothetical protein
VSITFKVVTTGDGVTANKGANGMGVSSAEAEADVKARNKRAEELGITTRYKVQEWAPGEAA